MKHVMSISLGSSKRDAGTEVYLGGQRCVLERVGTNGDRAKMLALFQRWSGKVDAFGLGGTDLYIYAGDHRYTFEESKLFQRAAGATPVFDGSGLKNTLERQVVRLLQRRGIIDVSSRKILLVCGVDRFGMAETFSDYGADIVFGDLMFGLSLPLPIRRLSTLHVLARLIAPILTKMPIRYFYPVGSAQEKRDPKFTAYFAWADLIAGDFHFIRRYMPKNLPGKIVLTNTVTREDKEALRCAGVRLLVTTTPDFGGRSFGTNLLEALFYAVSGNCCPAEDEVARLMEDLAVEPGIFYLDQA